MTPARAQALDGTPLRLDKDVRAGYESSQRSTTAKAAIAEAMIKNTIKQAERVSVSYRLTPAS